MALNSFHDDERVFTFPGRSRTKNMEACDCWIGQTGTHHSSGDVVRSEADGSPEVEDNGEHARPDGHKGHAHEGGRADGPHDVGPDSLAVHDALQPREPVLEERAVGVVEEHLEVTLHQGIK